MIQPRNRQKLQSKTHQHDRLIYVRQGATYLKLTCSLPGCSHSCFRTCSQASHSAPTSWTQLVAHTQTGRNETKENDTNKPTAVGDLQSRATKNKQELKTKRCENDELGSFYRNREAKKTRWRPQSPPRILRHVTLSSPCPCCKNARCGRPVSYRFCNTTRHLSCTISVRLCDYYA